MIRVLLILVLSVSSAFAQSADWLAYTNSALTNSVQTVKGSPGPWLAYNCYNSNATQAWFQIFDAISGVVLGTTVPKRSVPLAGLSLTGLQLPSPPFSGAVGLQVAATSTATGGSAPASPVYCEFYYR